MSLFDATDGIRLPEFSLPQVLSPWRLPPALRVLSACGSRHTSWLARRLASHLPLLEKLPDDLRKSLISPAAIRFSLDDRSIVLRFDPALACNRPLFLCSIFEPQVFGLLRLLSPIVRVFFDLGAGLGLHGLHLASMHDFKGIVHTVEDDPTTVDVTRELAQQLVLGRRLVVHGTSEDDVSLAALPLPDLVRLDLSYEAAQLPKGVPAMIEAARPILILRLPDDVARIAEISAWLDRRGFVAFDPMLEIGRDRIGPADAWPKRARLTLAVDTDAAVGGRYLLAMPRYRVDAVLDHIFECGVETRVLETA